MKVKKPIPIKKNTSKNKGFTLIEIIAVIIIIGILIAVSGIAVTGYIANSRAKTYESYKKDLEGASDNYLINCMSNNEESCSIPEYGNDLRITYNELVDKGYSEELKDPEGDGYCDTSYVIAKNTSQDGVDIEYQVCLYCSNYKTQEKGCEEITSSDTTTPTCGAKQGESKTWTNENRVIVVGCTDFESGCKKKEFSRSFGKEGEVITKGTVTIEDNAGNKTNCKVNAYVDKKAPTCEITLNAAATNGWHKTGVTASLSNVSDQGSGVAEKGIGTSLINRSYNGKTSYTVTGGIVTVFGYVKDKAGNEGYCSKQVKVDNTKPSGNIYMGYEVYPKENSTMSDATLTINNISKYGDIDGVIVYFSEELNSSLSNDVKDSNGNSIKISGGLTKNSDKGILKITKGTYDKLQINVGDSTYASKIEKVEVIKNENVTSVWTNKDVSVYVDAKDTITGVGSYSYNNGSTYTTSNIKSYSSNTSNTVIVKDKVGNVSEKYTFTIDKIDKVVPELTVNAYTCSDPSSADSCHSSEHTFKNSTSTKNDTLTIDWTNQGGYFNYDVTEDNFENVKWEYNDYGNTEKISVSKESIKNNKNGAVTLTAAGYRVGKITAYDKAGNSTTINVEIKIDKTKPSCELLADGTIGSNSWYTDDVTISFKTHTDTGGSSVADYGIGSVTGNTTATLTTDTSSITYTGYIEDNAGNNNTCTITVKRDATNPTCGAISLSGTAGNNGWYTSDVTATKTDGSDATSGHVSTTLDRTSVTGDTKGTKVTLTTSDNAGNTCTTSKTVKIDKTKPTCGTISLSGTVGNNGWYTSDVTVTNTDGSDATSGHVSTTLDRTSVTGDTKGTKVTLTTIDTAGNTCTTSKTVKIDKTKPTCGTIILSGTVGNNGWYTSDVTVTADDGSDTTSGHASTTLNRTSVTGNTTGTEVKLTTTDNAGNICTTSKTVKIDKTPTVTISGNAGKWMCANYYMNSNKSCGKAGSDKASDCDTSNLISCLDPDGVSQYANIVGKVTYSVDSNTVTFTWNIQQGNAWLGSDSTHWIDFIIKDSNENNVNTTRIREPKGATWTTYSSHTGIVTYTFDKKGTYYVYTKSGTNTVVFNMSLATITVS